MPKKSKVNKLARMSDEERARYLQHRADMEEEARRRKRELVSRFIKNKLEKEESYARMNTAKINQQWRYILRKIKCKQMSKDIQGMMIGFNFMMERKDKLVKSLMSAIEDSDDQHRRAFEAHTENVSYFLSIGSESLDKLQMEYDQLKNDCLEKWEKEETELCVNQERSEFKLILITYIQDRDFITQNKRKENERATVKNDLRLEHEEDIYSLSRPKYMQIETFRNQLREVYAAYLDQHNPITTHYHLLRQKDEFYQRDIVRNQMRINEVNENLLNLQEEWMKTTNILNKRLSRMRTQKEELTKKNWLMKNKLKTEQNKGNDKLTLMVNASQDAITRFENIKEKLNKIIQLANICRKHEQDGDDFDFDKDNNVDALDYEHLNSSMIDECKQYSKMDAFMLKVNRVKVQTMCLKAEKTKLIKENIQLTHHIKRYLTELALKGKERPLSMKVQSDTQKMDLRGKMLNRPVTCIEGTLSNAVMHEKRIKAMDRKKNDCGIRAYPRVQCWMETS